MNSDFATIDALKTELDAILPMGDADERRLWEKLRLEWNFHSNHIEGNTLTYGETVLLLLHGQTHGNHSLREYEEMKAHDVGIKHLRNLAADKSRLITPSDIRDLNKIILKEPFWKPTQTPDGHPSRAEVIPGEYKTLPNSVLTASGELFEYASPLEVPSRMQALVDDLEKSLGDRKHHILTIAAKLHHDFVLIHPFDDGNGRVARMLVNYLFLRENYPPIIVPTEQKRDYLTSLRLADAGELESLEAFLGKQLEKSLKLAVGAAKGESIEEPSDVEKQVTLFIREQNSKDKVNEPDDDVLQPFIDSSVRPFVKKLDTKMRTLAPLFSRISLMATNGNGELMLDINPASTPTLNVVRPQAKHSFSYSYLYYQSSAANAFTHRTKVEIEYKKEGYALNHDGKILISKPYSEPMLAEEIDGITSRILAKTFEAIRSKAGQVG
ncbi:Fic family protein [Luteolibacter yonseiensis]|uniref:Fic family protein n=1 Tax=Luteolibacter yonseiensis TaxID=1144680 RepID=A0A934V870_9BACT|nr:Fic family protein [Luteolibacter yonseiensis]MBK1816937.1 Fic family protein [Luteolibacter yonseiensis]